MMSKRPIDDPDDDGIIDHPTAYDGRPLPPAANDFAAFLRMLEDGGLMEDLTAELTRINKDLSNHVLEYGGSPKAKLKLSLEFSLEAAIWKIKAGIDVTMPKPPRNPSAAWSTPDGRFSGTNPKQLQMFGLRDASAPDGPHRTV